MDSLNYHHLFYFWMITQEGGLARAATALRVSHSTVSAQLRALEAYLGAPLFERHGKRLLLTPLGSEVAAYAGQIFRMGNELVEVARGRAEAGPSVLRVGVVGALPKTLVHRLLEPAFESEPKTRIHLRQGELSGLLQELSAHRLHVVLSDVPSPSGTGAQVYSHLLGESDIYLYGTKALARQYRRDFPSALGGAPVLLPGPDTALRKAMERWFADRGLRPRWVGDIDDAGLLRVFGGAGFGLFPVRAALRTEVEESSGAECVGPMTGIRDRYYVISVERRVRHRAVAALIGSARAKLVEKAPDAAATKAKASKSKTTVRAVSATASTPKAKS